MKLLIMILLLGGAVYAAMVATYPAGTDPATDCTEVLIAKCISFPTNGPSIEVEHFKPPAVVVGDDFHPVEVEVVKMLKGGEHSGRRIIGAHYPMAPGRNYLLYRYGDEAGGPDVFAALHYMVVEVPSTFDLAQLEGKALGEQINMIYQQSLVAADEALRVGNGGKSR
jgi:hypothetical protein